MARHIVGGSRIANREELAMTSSAHNMRIPDELWKLVVAEADSRAAYIKGVDASYARYPRTRIVIDALIARYRDQLPETWIPDGATESLAATVPPWGTGPIETNRNSNPPPDPGHTALY
jgi:hypothetical protein